jgi:hypothetical protein
VGRFGTNFLYISSYSSTPRLEVYTFWVFFLSTLCRGPNWGVDCMPGTKLGCRLYAGAKSGYKHYLGCVCLVSGGLKGVLIPILCGYFGVDSMPGTKVGCRLYAGAKSGYKHYLGCVCLVS